MKFSLLLSLYNKENPYFLSECLKSIETNSHLPEQIVIVFDGPIGKELEEIVNNYAVRLPIDIVPINKNVGLGPALNYGLKFCKNEMVLRMDTDDICMPDRFAKQIDFLKLHPSIGLMGGAIQEYDESMNESKGIRFSKCQHKEIVEYAKKRNPFNHMTVAFRKSLVEQVGGYQHHHLMEDYNLWLRMIAAGVECYNMVDVLVKVRAGNNMLARRKGIFYAKSEIKIARLKYNLKIDHLCGCISCAVIRMIPRLLPVFALNYLYRVLRE